MKENNIEYLKLLQEIGALTHKYRDKEQGPAKLTESEYIKQCATQVSSFLSNVQTSTADAKGFNGQTDFIYSSFFTVPTDFGIIEPSQKVEAIQDAVMYFNEEIRKYLVKDTNGKIIAQTVYNAFVSDIQQGECFSWADYCLNFHHRVDPSLKNLADVYAKTLVLVYNTDETIGSLSDKDSEKKAALFFLNALDQDHLWKERLDKKNKKYTDDKKFTESLWLKSDEDQVAKIRKFLGYYYRLSSHLNSGSDSEKPLFYYFIKPGSRTAFYNGMVVICTRQPLDIPLYSFLYLLVYRIYSSTAFKHSEFSIQATLGILRAGMGHFLKNRIAGKQILTNQIVIEISKNGDVKNPLKNNLEKADIDLELIKNNCIKINKSDKHISNIGILFHVLSNALKHPNHSVFRTDFAKERKWITDKAIILDELINNLKKDYYEGSKTLQITESVKNLQIEPFFSSNNKKYCPDITIYQEIMYELLLNASKYGHSTDDTFNVIMNCEDNMFTLTNRVNEPEKLLFDKRYDNCKNVFAKMNHSHTNELSGITFIDEFITKAQIGELKVKISETQNTTFFTIGMHLHGLTLKTKTS
jgi:hypothetical protein